MKAMRPLMLIGFLLAACSQVSEAPAANASTSAAASAARHPTSGLEVVPLTVTPAGKPAHPLKVEMARTTEEQARGLMFRTEMGADEGMLFPYDPPRIVSFWMRNTVLSLDLIFIGPDRRVINVAANAVPYSEASIYSDAPAIAVLELNAGRAKALGIVPGTRVDW